MTKKLRILLISVFFLIATVCVCVFAGCKVKFTVDELKEKYGLSSQITYFLNSDGGSFNGSYVKNLYYKPGSMPMNIGSSSLVSGSSEMRIKAGNTFTGWYYVETDKDGNPLYAYEEGEEKRVYSDGDEYDVTKGAAMAITDEEFDFTKPIEEGKHIYLCGDFIGDVRVELHLLCESFGDSVFDHIEYENSGETVTVQDGEIIEYGCNYIPKANGLDNYSGVLQNKLTGYTVVDFFEKDEETGEFTPFTGWPIMYPEADEDGEYPDKVLYLKVLEGNWQLVNNYSDVSRMFAVGAAYNYYITQDIDCEGQRVNSITTFSGKIFGGNGDAHVIKNLTVRRSGDTALGIGVSASMFGTVKASAVIDNVNFENVSVNFTIRANGDPDICFIANSIEDGATFKNASISGSLNITLLSESSFATSVSKTKWLYGDRANEEFDGITVSSATCTVTASNGTETVYKVTDNKNDVTVGDNNQTEDLS